MAAGALKGAPTIETPYERPLTEFSSRQSALSVSPHDRHPHDEFLIAQRAQASSVARRELRSPSVTASPYEETTLTQRMAYWQRYATLLGVQVAGP
jgi:hypothetical protein